MWAATTRHCHGCTEVVRMEKLIPEKATGEYVVLLPHEQVMAEEIARYERELREGGRKP